MQNKKITMSCCFGALCLTLAGCGGGGGKGEDADAGDPAPDPAADQDLFQDPLEDEQPADLPPDVPEDADAADDGEVEAPEPRLNVDCSDSTDDVYVTPSDLPPHTESARGDIVRCAPEGTLTVEQVTSRIRAAGITDVTPTTAVETFLIAYRTERMGSTPGVGTARVFVPEISRPGADVMVVSNHGTIGLADRCAPSTMASGTDYLTLPFAGTGFVVIAPDYAGLGNEGVQGYGRNDDTGHSVLDASRALVRMLTPGSLSGDIVLTGHSQGGGSTLSGLALSEAYGSGGRVVAAVPFAPGWAIDTPDPVIYQYPQFVPTDFVLLMYLYADAANALGLDHATDFFHPDIRADVENSVSTMCVLGLAAWVAGNCSRLDEMADPDMLQGVSDCLTGGTCVEPAAGFVERLENNILPLPAGGPSVLVVQGLADDMATPEHTRCIVEYMESEGVTPRICVDDEADHMNIVERNMGFVLQWLDAVTEGNDLPRCTNETLPDCT